jgi:hypothetical protein
MLATQKIRTITKQLTYSVKINLNELTFKNIKFSVQMNHSGHAPIAAGTSKNKAEPTVK